MWGDLGRYRYGVIFGDGKADDADGRVDLVDVRDGGFVERLF